MILIINGLEVLIDDEDYEKISIKQWTLRKYHTSNKYRVISSGGKPEIYMHRLIMNFPKGKQIDHINGNGLDNRKDNLRICTINQNTKNRNKYKSNTSGYKGVYLSKRSNKWIANIHCEYKTYYLGSFKNIKDAAIAYNNAAIKYFGKFANLNVIEN